MGANTIKKKYKRFNPRFYVRAIKTETKIRQRICAWSPFERQWWILERHVFQAISDLLCMAEWVNHMAVCCCCWKREGFDLFIWLLYATVELFESILNEMACK